MEKLRKTPLDHGFTSLSGGLNKAAMFDDLHFKSTKVAGEEIVAFDLSASVHQHQKIAKAIRQRLHNWLIQALEAVTEPRHHREPVRYPSALMARLRATPSKAAPDGRLIGPE